MLTPNTLIQQRYLIQRRIGQGGMGAVYEAVDQRLSAVVALKQMTITGAAAQQAFEREARILANLRHPSLPKVMDHFSDPAGQFLVMEFIPGADLLDMQHQRGQPFPIDEVLAWADQLLEVLEYLHSEEIIHRDIKPQNMKLTARRQLVLLDFGLARHLASGSVRGFTPQYAPLEQIDGTGTDPRSDLYSASATLYYLLASSPPVSAMTRWTALTGGRPDPLPPLHTCNPAVPLEISAIVMRALSVQRDERPASATVMRQALHTARHLVQSAASAASPTIPMMLPPAVPEAPTTVREAQTVPLPAPPVPAHPLPRGARTRMFGMIAGVLLLVGIISRLAAGVLDGTGSFAWLDLTRTPASSTSTAPPVPATPLEPTSTPVPQPVVAIVPENATRITELAYWGWSVSAHEIVFASDGHLLAVGTSGGIYLYATETLDEVRFIATNPPEVIIRAADIALSSDGQTLASNSWDGTVKLWRVADGSLLRTLDENTSSDLSPHGLTITSEEIMSSVAFSPDGQIVASEWDDGVKLWRVADGSLLRTLGWVRKRTPGIAFAPDGETLAAVSLDGTMKLWRVADGSLLHTLDGYVGKRHSLAFSPDGQTLTDGVRLWRVVDGGLLHTLKGRSNGPVESAAFSPDGQTLVSGTKNGIVELWRVTDGRLLHTLQGHRSSVRSVAFSPDGRTLISGSGDGMRLWGVAP